MWQSCSIEPNMMNAPWLDKPTKITESELDNLELNYQTMLDTIRNDTFGGIMPPKISLDDIADTLSFSLHRSQSKSSPHHDSSVINIFTDHHDQETQSSNLLSSLEFETDSFTNDIFMNDEVNASVQRVRMQLNTTPETSPSLSPIQHSNDTSLININLNQISQSLNERDVDGDESKHNLSLPFMSPSTNNDDNDNMFITDSISPPIFNTSSRRSRSEQPSHHMFLNSSAFSSAPPRSQNASTTQVIQVPSRSPPQISLEQLNQTQSQILTHFGVPDSVTSSMMESTRSMNANYSFNANDSASFDINHNIERQVPAAPQRRNIRNIRNRSRYIPNRMVHVINDSSTSIDFAHHSVHNIADAVSDQMDSSFAQSIEDETTPRNLEIRSNSVSLEAPRAQRRQINRRGDVSSVDLTANSNMNL